MYLKAYPCGGRGHTAIEAALALRERVGARLADITNIHCSLTKSSAQRVDTQYPETVEAAKFSAAYVVAYSLVHGTPRIPAFTEAALNDAREGGGESGDRERRSGTGPDGLGRKPRQAEDHASRTGRCSSSAGTTRPDRTRCR